MIKKKKEKNLPLLLEQYYLEEQNKITSSREWIAFSNAYKNLRKAAYDTSLPFNPKFNAVHWAFDVAELCKEIAFSCWWMNSYAEFYKKQVSPGSQPAHVDFHVSYFADNCVTRIDSCRDKLALTVWAFYCPFNPENKKEVLDYPRIVERLRCPIKFGIGIKNQNDFLKHLEMLRGSDFSRIERYRHLKVHRIEPRIEMYGVNSHHAWDYMFPLLDKKDIQRWEQGLGAQYPNQHLREHIKKGCHINGVPFERRKITDSLWDYEQVSKHIKSSMIKLLTASAGCFRILRKRSPLKKNRAKSKKRSPPQFSAV